MKFYRQFIENITNPNCMDKLSVLEDFFEFGFDISYDEGVRSEIREAILSVYDGLNSEEKRMALEIFCKVAVWSEYRHMFLDRLGEDFLEFCRIACELNSSLFRVEEIEGIKHSELGPYRDLDRNFAVAYEVLKKYNSKFL